MSTLEHAASPPDPGPERPPAAEDDRRRLDRPRDRARDPRRPRGARRDRVRDRGRPGVRRGARRRPGFLRRGADRGPVRRLPHRARRARRPPARAAPVQAAQRDRLDARRLRDLPRADRRSTRCSSTPSPSSRCSRTSAPRRTRRCSIAQGILVVGLAPISEELFFRGFLFGGLRGRLSFWPAALISGVFFGLIHLLGGTLAVIPPLAAFGVLLAWLYERTGSIGPPILMHALQNAIAFTITIS